MYRNKKLLALSRGQACVLCNAQDSTIVSAHSNFGEHGKGMGMKAEDCYIAWLCHRCHAQLDQGMLSYDERRDRMLTAIVRTYGQMFKQGLIGVSNARLATQATDPET